MSDRLSRPDLPAGADGLPGLVARHLSEHIAAHDLRPGDKLPAEGDLVRVLGVSRPVVREALSRLAGQGSIVIAPGRAPRVGALQSGLLRQVFEHAMLTGQAEPRQVLEVRRGLEIAMAGEAALRRPVVLLDRLAALSAQMAAALHQPARFAAIDLDFHHALAEASGNPFYLVLLDACRGAVAASMEAGLRRRNSEAALTRVQALHEEILAAIAAADAAGARDAMTRHFDDALAAFYAPPPIRRRAR